jgi:hypothetical protein
MATTKKDVIFLIVGAIPPKNFRLGNRRSSGWYS